MDSLDSRMFSYLIYTIILVVVFSLLPIVVQTTLFVPLIDLLLLIVAIYTIREMKRSSKETNRFMLERDASKDSADAFSQSLISCQKYLFDWFTLIRPNGNGFDTKFQQKYSGGCRSYYEDTNNPVNPIRWYTATGGDNSDRVIQLNETQFVDKILNEAIRRIDVNSANRIKFRAHTYRCINTIEDLLIDIDALEEILKARIDNWVLVDQDNCMKKDGHVNGNVGIITYPKKIDTIFNFMKVKVLDILRNQLSEIKQTLNKSENIE